MTNGDKKKKYCFRDKKKFQKIMSRACATLSDLNFSSDDSSNSKEDERPKRKTGVSDDSSPEGLSLRVTELENVLCNQDKLLGKVFRENKKLNLELESIFF
jgi:hypothetical protein